MIELKLGRVARAVLDPLMHGCFFFSRLRPNTIPNGEPR
jgi:hypothetical protein